jgi:hypothetical protein
LEGVEYFTTLATWDPAKVARHRLFIKANETEGVKVTYGEFKRKQRKCSECSKLIRTFEEKQTDVNIALRLFELAVQAKYDKAILVSGDTDMIPAVKAVQKTFPAKKVKGGDSDRACFGRLETTDGFPSPHEAPPSDFKPFRRSDRFDRWL